MTSLTKWVLWSLAGEEGNAFGCQTPIRRRRTQRLAKFGGWPSFETPLPWGRAEWPDARAKTGQ